MSQLRNTVPALLSVGIGYYGYQYVYKVKHSGPVQIDDGITVVKPWKVFFYSRLPLNAASRLWGNVNNLELPTWARKPVLGLYAWLFNCNTSEMAVSDLTKYRNLGEFFRRGLKPGCRPVDNGCSLTCPSDGTILHFGKVSGDQVEQVKGVTYALSRFLGPKDWIRQPLSDADEESTAINTSVAQYSDQIKHSAEETDLYHAVIYLAPGDYHRFHSPTEWNVYFRRHFPGLLLSVSPSIVRRIPNLFCLNERVVYIGNWEHGFISLVAVGATNVGSVKIYHDKSLHTNSGHKYSKGFHIDKTYYKGGHLKPVSFRRGDSFGEFNLGSTVVVIFEAPKSFTFAVKPGQKVKYGQVLGK